MRSNKFQVDRLKRSGLYNPAYEYDACGLGFLVNINGEKSHEIISNGVRVLKNLLHRGATGADDKTGDGAGLQFQIPDRFFRRLAAENGWVLPEPLAYGVGMVFLSHDQALREKCFSLMEQALQEMGLAVIGWRTVPVVPEGLGTVALENMPFMSQCLIDGNGFSDHELERKLYIARKDAEKRVATLLSDAEIFYVVSLSCRTIIYKGLLMPDQVEVFYPDLTDQAMESTFVIVHQRFSTNTFPSWSLAHPYRYLCHNGEINTLKGNRNWMASRENNFESELFGDDLNKVLPVLEAGASDSANLDNALELLYNGGRSIEHGMAMLIPQAWGDKYPIGPDLRGFFEYHAGLIEPWDGPAQLFLPMGVKSGPSLTVMACARPVTR